MLSVLVGIKKNKDSQLYFQKVFLIGITSFFIRFFSSEKAKHQTRCPSLSGNVGDLDSVKALLSLGPTELLSYSFIEMLSLIVIYVPIELQNYRTTKLPDYIPPILLSQGETGSIVNSTIITKKGVKKFRLLFWMNYVRF